jgi:hypothetical protein
VRPKRSARAEVEGVGATRKVAARVTEGPVDSQRTERTCGPEVDEPGEQSLVDAA